MKKKLLHRGSVKDIYQISDEELLFQFSNRYSIFDWGEMPDEIPNKGRSLAKLGNKLLCRLSEDGFSTHFLRSGPSDCEMVVKAVTVPREGLAIYKTKPTNILVPLEVIYRFGVPKGSSLLKRYSTEEQWIAAGYARKYHEGEDFAQVKLDYTTKLERLDRVLSEQEARELSGMDEVEWKNLNEFATATATRVREIFNQSELKLWDGKFEFALDENRKPMLVDSIGLDEIRLTYQGTPLSKELLRQLYVASDWYQALTKAKEASPQNFKDVCELELKQKPEPLARDQLAAISDLYGAVSEIVLPADPAQVPVLQARIRQSLQLLAGAR